MVRAFAMQRSGVQIQSPRLLKPCRSIRPAGFLRALSRSSLACPTTNLNIRNRLYPAPCRHCAHAAGIASPCTAGTSVGSTRGRTTAAPRPLLTALPLLIWTSTASPTARPVLSSSRPSRQLRRRLPDRPHRGRQGRWKKKYRGRPLYLGSAGSKSDLAAYRQAMDVWRTRKAEIDAEEAARPKPHQGFQVWCVHPIVEFSTESHCSPPHRPSQARDDVTAR